MRERARLHRQPSTSTAEDERKRISSPYALMEPGMFSDAAQPLPESVRRPFEEGYGHDFSQVRIHAGQDAGAAATSMESRAYTAGRDIVFGPGEYAPDTAAGRTLLAHELGHVVQQRGTVPASGGDYQLHQTGDAHEREAGNAATHVLAGYSAPPLSDVGPGAHVQRWPRLPPFGTAPPQKADPIAESERASRDYTDAVNYINDFYGDVIRCLDFAYAAESTAIGIFTRITSTPDPPNMTKEAVMSVLSLGFTAVGGWGLIEKGLTRGIFATNLWRMQRGLGEKFSPQVVEALGKLGSRERDAELAKHVLDLAKDTVGAGKAGAGAAGGEQETDAGRTTESANKAAVKTLVNWGEKSSVAATEKEIAKANLGKIRDDPKYRQGLLNETRAALGDRPDAIAMGKIVQKVEERYELELYKRRYGGDQGVYIQEITGRMGTYSRTLKGGGDSMGRVVKRICEIQGWPKDELRVGAWLGVPTRVTKRAESGKMM